MATYFSPAVAAVIGERIRQITEEGWTPDHDDDHNRGELARAAACYAVGSQIRHRPSLKLNHELVLWPWDNKWWKPGSERDNLVKAGALILAEIERLDRLNGEPAVNGPANKAASTTLVAPPDTSAEVTLDISGESMTVAGYTEHGAGRHVSVSAASLLTVVRKFDLGVGEVNDFTNAFDDLRGTFSAKEIASGELEADHDH